ncbi:MAG: hypothetical protein HFH73_00955 [Lachnospiraceae bacterium]|jgi:lactate dehydrogenase-like 2-hydroxyacid dehydrogenase|nr:hypothetical protein [Lachnospiraceae bacterium]
MKRKIAIAISFAVGVISGIGFMRNRMKKELHIKSMKINKFKGYYSLLVQWFELRQKGKKLEQFFIENGYQVIAIYGMGELGKCLYEELKDIQGVEIKYGIDQESAYCGELEIRSLDDLLPDVDAIIVTPIFAYNEIEEILRQKTHSSIVSLDDVLYGIDC